MEASVAHRQAAVSSAAGRLPRRPVPSEARRRKELSAAGRSSRPLAAVSLAIRRPLVAELRAKHRLAVDFLVNRRRNHKHNQDLERSRRQALSGRSPRVGSPEDSLEPPRRHLSPLVSARACKGPAKLAAAYLAGYRVRRTLSHSNKRRACRQALVADSTHSPRHPPRPSQPSSNREHRPLVRLRARLVEPEAVEARAAFSKEPSRHKTRLAAEDCSVPNLSNKRASSNKSRAFSSLRRGRRRARLVASAVLRRKALGLAPVSLVIQQANSPNNIQLWRVSQALDPLEDNSLSSNSSLEWEEPRARVVAALSTDKQTSTKLK